MPKRNHPESYYTIRDVVIAGMGPEFDERTFKRLFPAAARPHKFIPYTDGYLDVRHIIMNLVKAKMREAHRVVPKEQLQLPIVR